MRIVISEGKINDVAKKWLTDNYGDLERYETDKYPDYIFFMKDGEVIFDYNQKNGHCHIGYDEIWSFLKSVFQLEDKEIQGITKDWVEEHYKLRVTTTYLLISHSSKGRWKNIRNQKRG
jgi:hypothetical protein